MSTMLNHLPFTKLADLVEGRLSSSEQETSSAHLSTCARCASQLASLQKVVDLMQTDEAEDAPAEIVSSAINLFHSPAATHKPSLRQRIVAAISFDSLQMSPAYGVRSGDRVSIRQMLFNAGECDLDLRLTQSGEMWNVSGQVLGQECASGQVELVSDSSQTQVELNDQCEFTIADVPAGSYQLRLHLPDLEVEVPRIELKA